MLTLSYRISAHLAHVRRSNLVVVVSKSFSVDPRKVRNNRLQLWSRHNAFTQSTYSEEILQPLIHFFSHALSSTSEGVYLMHCVRSTPFACNSTHTNLDHHTQTPPFTPTGTPTDTYTITPT